jgi:hypothetical protein
MFEGELSKPLKPEDTSTADAVVCSPLTRFHLTRRSLVAGVQVSAIDGPSCVAQQTWAAARDSEQRTSLHLLLGAAQVYAVIVGLLAITVRIYWRQCRVNH